MWLIECLISEETVAFLKYLIKQDKQARILNIRVEAQGKHTQDNSSGEQQVFTLVTMNSYKGTPVSSVNLLTWILFISSQLCLF